MNHYRAIIVEDEPYAARYIKGIVERSATFEVCALCESAEEAIDLLPTLDVDLMITDIKMAGMSGLEMLQEIRTVYPDLQVIIISGYNHFEYAKTAISMGVCEYLLKPINGEELQETLEKVLARLNHNCVQKRRQYVEAVGHHSQRVLERLCSDEKNRYQVLMVAGSLSQEAVMLCCEEQFQLSQNKWVNAMFYRHTLVIVERHKSPCDLINQLSKAIMHWERERVHTISLVCNREAVCGARMAHILQKMYIFQQNHMGIAQRRCLDYHEKQPQKDYDVAKEKGLLERVIQDINTKNEKALARDYQKLFAFWENNQATLHSVKQGMYRMLLQLFQLESASNDPITEINESLNQLYRCATYQEAQEGIWQVAMPLVERFHVAKSGTQFQSQQMYWNILEYINSNIGRNFSLQEVSDTFGVSQPYVSKLFRMYGGNSYKEYVTQRKIAIAIELMEQYEGMFIKDIAEHVGYEHLYFSTVFYRVKGKYPKEYRELLKENKIE